MKRCCRRTLRSRNIKSLLTLPKLGAADSEGFVAASGLKTGARVGPYELIRLLGAGGMAEVWLARRDDGAFNREVALKLPLLTKLRPDLEQRFARERDILASLEHPLIARLYDAGIDPKGLPYLAMEYVPGQPLTSRCDAQRLGIPERLQLILQVLEAVQYAHEKQVIHRDLKPSNILVTESGQVRLLDFGVSKLLGAADEEQQGQLTRYLRSCAHPGLCQPGAAARGYRRFSQRHLFRGRVAIRNADRRSALPTQERGARSARSSTPSPRLMYKNPAPSASRKRALPAIPRGEGLMRQLHGDLDAIVLKALAKDPAERYQSADALADDLRRHLHHEADPCPPPYARLPAADIHISPPQARGAERCSGSHADGGRAGLVRGRKGLLLAQSPCQCQIHPPLGLPRDRAGGGNLARRKTRGISGGAGRAKRYLGQRGGQRHLPQFDEWRGRRARSTPEIRALGFSADSSLVTVWTRRADGSQAGDVNILAVPTAGGALQPYLREVGEYDWSRDGKRLVYHTTAPGDPFFLRESEQPGNRGDRRIYVAEAGVHSHFPVWSPDDAYIYFVRGVPPGDWDIWRIQPSGAGLERLTFHHTRVTFPVMLDRRTLLYLATDEDGSGPWMYAMDVERRVPHRISSGLESYTSLASSADGMRLVATIASARTSVWRIPLTEERGAATAAGGPSLVSANAAVPRLGADFLLYVSWRGDRQGIWSLTHGNTREIWSSATSHIVGGPAIAPDGRRIAFSVEEGEKWSLYIMDQDGARARVLSDSLALRGNPAWAPDGQSIVIAVVRDGEPRLTRIFLNGDAPLPLVSEYSVDPVWSPDGRFLVYSGADVGTTFPLRAAAADGRPYPFPSVMLSRGVRVEFFRDPQTLVTLGGEIGHQNPSLLDLRSGVQRILAELPADFMVRDFDIPAAGSEIVFDRVQVNSDLALIERKRQ